MHRKIFRRPRCICVCIAVISAIAVSARAESPSPQTRMYGAWEQGSCDEKGLICSQLTWTLMKDGRATWDGYPPLHGHARFRILKISGNDIVLHIDHGVGDVGTEVRDLTVRLALAPDAKNDTLTEIAERRTTFTVQRSTVWHRKNVE